MNMLARDVFVQTCQYSIKQLLDEIVNGSLFYSSNILLSNREKSKMIENLFLKIPLVSGVFIQRPNFLHLLIGENIMESFNSYVNEESFALSGLEYFPELNGKYFSELPLRWKRYILESLWTIQVIDCPNEEVSQNICQRYLKMLKH